VLLLDGGHDQAAVRLAHHERDRALGGDEVEAGEVGDAGRVEDRDGVEPGGFEAGADGLAPGRELGGRDLGRLQ
jgi:hypothetical protein